MYILDGIIEEIQSQDWGIFNQVKTCILGLRGKSEALNRGVGVIGKKRHVVWFKPKITALECIVSIRSGLELIIEFAGKVWADLSGEGGEVLGEAA
jgi:hypothetical protein